MSNVFIDLIDNISKSLSNKISKDTLIKHTEDFDVQTKSIEGRQASSILKITFASMAVDTT